MSPQEKPMSQQLLVPIKSCGQVQELLPYLEDVARTGMTMIFLVHFGTNRFAQLAGLLLEMQSGLPANFLSDCGVQQSHFTHRLEHASRTLNELGVRIEVKFYSGRLQPLLRQCIEDDNHHTVIMRPIVKRPFHWLTSFFSALRLHGSSRAIPVLLCQPGIITRR
jgi:hypothetical protein